MTPYVLPFTAVGAQDLAVAGGKGANLGELVRAGFAVPDGVVVTTRAYREALRGFGHLDPGEPAALRAALETVTLGAGLVEEILDAYAGLGEGAVAVRSSATAEDLPGAAFAGQQETFLNVVGPDAVLDAVRHCWASLWADRAVAYRSRLAPADAPEIAVVMQRMVPAEQAGVLFTADPVTGARDQVVIEASAGLGEAVVAGLVTPEHVVVDAAGRISERRPGRREVVIRGAADGGVVRDEANVGPGADLPEAVLTDLARTGRAVAAHFGRPQDIEWAYADGTTWIVQARPLTALPPAPLRVGRLRRAAGAITAELLPVRPYPLDLTAWTVPGWFRILARMAGELPAVRVDVEAMFVVDDAVLRELQPPDPRPTWRTLTTPLRLRGQVRRFDPARWTADPRFAAWEARLQELTGRDVTSMTWPDLLAVPHEALALLDAVVDVRIDHLPAAAVALVRLRVLLTLLGLTSEFWPLLQGQPTQTRAANDALQAVADQVQTAPAWREAFGSASDDELVALVWRSEPYRPLRTALEGWLGAYGHRETTSAALVSAPTWSDDPALLLGHLRGLVGQQGTRPGERGASGPERRLRGRRRVLLTRTGPRISAAAAAARGALAFREDSHFHALRVRSASRAALLEAGRRLKDAGVLGERDDVFHLTLPELLVLDDPGALGDAEVARLQGLVRRRTLRRAELGAAPLISPATLFPGRRRPSADALVSGTPGGGGRATGPVRVVREPAEFSRLEPGDVLVCPYTNPAWTPLFALAAAVVADSGSFGSHAAIVAREYGIPAVMGTGSGTRVLTDGQRVVVDGDRGDVVAEPGGGRG